MSFEKFQVGKPVSGKDFIGRDEELKLMMQLLVQGQSIVLIAPRRYGKTSLVNEVLRRLDNKGFYTMYVDLFSNPTMDGLASNITQAVLSNKRLDKAFVNFTKNLKEIVKNIEFRHEIDQHEFILGFNDKNQNPNELLGESIDFIESFARKNKKQMIAAFDEFGDLAKYGSEKMVKLFRAKMQTHKNSAYIFSGSYESVMNELFVTPKSPFYRFARIIQLKGIGNEVFTKYIIEKLKLKGQKITNDALQLLLAFTKGHPYYTQLLVQQIILFHKEKRTIDKRDIEQVKEDAVTIELSYIEKTWEELSRTRELIPVLLAIASKELPVYTATAKHPGNTSRALRKLINGAVITKQGNEYEFNDPLLSHWISKNLI